MIKIKRVHPDAVMPSKAHPSDVGYDLTAIAFHSAYLNGATLFDTGITAVAPEGYYLEILPRSSLSKTGWMLANSVGVIDPNYRGNLLIALVRVSPNAPALELPAKCCQLVLRKLEHADILEVGDLDETDRGSGGFGSTD